jgi:hypothetical protein
MYDFCKKLLRRKRFITRMIGLYSCSKNGKRRALLRFWRRQRAEKLPELAGFLPAAM